MSVKSPRWLLSLSLSLAAAAIACAAFAGDPAPDPAPNPASDPAPEGADAENDPAFHDALRAAARGYKGWGRADNALRFAPTLCRAPMPQDYPPVPARMSASADADTHGRKLYYLFASDPLHYLSLPPHSAAPEGFTIVKESWQAMPSPSSHLGNLNKPKQDPSGARYIDHIQLEGGGFYHTGAQTDLFIMYKLDPATPGTDQGWVYGTVTPDGASVTSAGRVASCMGCHASAPHDRLFGITPPKAGKAHP